MNPAQQTRATPEYDAIVVGGGPAGSSTAIALARAGRRVLVLERECFPRFHIGESQLPWSEAVFRQLGISETIARAGFIEKWGAAFVSADGLAERYVDFSMAAETPFPQTYQVPRADFDDLLLAHASSSGAHVSVGTRAVEATFDEDHVTVTYESEEASVRVTAAAVVDASGRSGFLAKRLAERRYDALLHNVALHAQYEGIPRLSGRRAGDIRIIMRADSGWFWFIPLSATLTSVGVVIPKDLHTSRKSDSLDDTLEQMLRETPGAFALVDKARRVTATRFDADYSYDSVRFAGDRWVAVGDAGAFLDPIFSTGVLLALQSGLEAAAAIERGLRIGNLGARTFADYQRAVRRRYRHFRRFAVGFYDPVFRDVFFSPAAPFRIREAVLSVLAGNWRPRLATRLRIGLFFGVVTAQRLLGKRIATAAPLA